MPSQAEKGRAFRALHESKQLFIIPNPWDVGSARILEGLGFFALATTSAAFAISRGLLDGQPGRDAVMQHARELAAATDLPISGDLENGFANAPQEVAETIRRAAAAGLCGGSIEDYTGNPDQPLYPIEHAAERVRAAVEAANALDFPFTVTARSENLLRVKPFDIKETISRLQAYQEAGAPVLFAPGLGKREDIQTVLREIDRPLNVLAGVASDLTIPQLAELGVRRVSLGGWLGHVAYGALIHAATELKETGTLGFTAEGSRAKDLRKLLRR